MLAHHTWLDDGKNPSSAVNEYSSYRRRLLQRAAHDGGGAAGAADDGTKPAGWAATPLSSEEASDSLDWTVAPTFTFAVGSGGAARLRRGGAPPADPTTRANWAQSEWRCIITVKGGAGCPHGAGGLVVHCEGADKKAAKLKASHALMKLVCPMASAAPAAREQPPEIRARGAPSRGSRSGSPQRALEEQREPMESLKDKIA